MKCKFHLCPLLSTKPSHSPLFPIVECLMISSHRTSLSSPGSLLHTVLSFKYFLILSLHFPLLNFTPLSPSYTTCTTLINQPLLPLHHFVVWSLICFCVGGMKGRRGMGWRANGKVRKKKNNIGKKCLRAVLHGVLLFHKS